MSLKSCRGAGVNAGSRDCRLRSAPHRQTNKREGETRHRREETLNSSLRATLPSHVIAHLARTHQIIITL